MLKGLFQNLLINRICPNPLMFLQGDFMLMRAELGLIFPVNLRKVLIFTDFPTGSGSKICALLKICEYQGHPSGNWKIS